MKYVLYVYYNSEKSLQTSCFEVASEFTKDHLLEFFTKNKIIKGFVSINPFVSIQKIMLMRWNEIRNYLEKNSEEVYEIKIMKT